MVYYTIPYHTIQCHSLPSSLVAPSSSSAWVQVSAHIQLLWLNTWLHRFLMYSNTACQSHGNLVFSTLARPCPRQFCFIILTAVSVWQEEATHRRPRLSPLASRTENSPGDRLSSCGCWTHSDLLAPAHLWAKFSVNLRSHVCLQLWPLDPKKCMLNSSSSSMCMEGWLVAACDECPAYLDLH